jgi:hypothetical protein
MKEDALPAPFDVTPITPFDTIQLAVVKSEIASVLGDRLITPDEVRGDAADLSTAVTTTGWPSVADARGRFLFFVDNPGAVQDRYLDLHPNLQGALMFTSAGFGAPHAGVLKVNDPGDGTEIRSLVEQGYLVRTRSDADVVNPSVSQRDQALTSGGKVVHSDFPKGEPKFGTGYVVEFPTRVQARGGGRTRALSPTSGSSVGRLSGCVPIRGRRLLRADHWAPWDPWRIRLRPSRAERFRGSTPTTLGDAVGTGSHIW